MILGMRKKPEHHPAQAALHHPPPLLSAFGDQKAALSHALGTKALWKAPMKGNQRRPSPREHPSLQATAQGTRAAAISPLIPAPFSLVFNEGRKTAGAAISCCERQGRGWRQENTGQAAGAWSMQRPMTRSPKPCCIPMHLLASTWKSHQLPEPWWVPGAQESALSPGASLSHRVQQPRNSREVEKERERRESPGELSRGMFPSKALVFLSRRLH